MMLIHVTVIHASVPGAGGGPLWFKLGEQYSGEMDYLSKILEFSFHLKKESHTHFGQYESQ